MAAPTLGALPPDVLRRELLNWSRFDLVQDLIGEAASGTVTYFSVMQQEWANRQLPPCENGPVFALIENEYYKKVSLLLGDSILDAIHKEAWYLAVVKMLLTREGQPEGPSLSSLFLSRSAAYWSLHDRHLTSIFVNLPRVGSYIARCSFFFYPAAPPEIASGYGSLTMRATLEVAAQRSLVRECASQLAFGAQFLVGVLRSKMTLGEAIAGWVSGIAVSAFEVLGRVASAGIAKRLNLQPAFEQAFQLLILIAISISTQRVRRSFVVAKSKTQFLRDTSEYFFWPYLRRYITDTPPPMPPRIDAEMKKVKSSFPAPLQGMDPAMQAALAAAMQNPPPSAPTLPAPVVAPQMTTPDLD
ncbi:hypothetical protein DIPPA_23776 [Diplonema papillatum]|nr:hypothetical protein DIPPA_23776 [Diplonema papillatum]